MMMSFEAEHSANAAIHSRKVFHSLHLAVGSWEVTLFPCTANGDSLELGYSNEEKLVQGDG